MASGMPSSRSQISAIAARFALPSTVGSSARARSTNSATAGSSSRRGTVTTRSSVRPSLSRDVASTVTSGHAMSTAAASCAAASTTCSQLSRTSRAPRDLRLSVMLRTRSAPWRSVTPRTSATARGTSEGDRIVASSTSQPSLVACSRATASARLVLPIPPGPTRLTSRWAPSAVRSRLSSSSRPTSRGSRRGRLPRWRSAVRSGGCSPGSTWKIVRSVAAPSSDHRPRSRNGVASNPAVAADASVWPPCPTAASRDARCTAGPK